MALIAVVPTAWLAWFLGTSEGGELGARLALAVVLTIHALWIVTVLIAIPLYYRSLRYELHHDEVIVQVGVQCCWKYWRSSAACGATATGHQRPLDNLHPNYAHFR